jgi:hypothetical protein
MPRSMPRPLLASSTPVRVVLLVAGVMAAAACAHSETGDVVGSSHTAIDAPPGHGDDGAAVDDSLPAGWRDELPKLGRLDASRGHGTGNWPATVYADIAGAKALDGEEDAPAGATLVEVHPSKRGELLFIMQKRESGDGGSGARWQFRVHDVDGTLQAPPACAGCHDQAPHDDLFILAADAGR